jgi:hypothetical protein
MPLITGTIYLFGQILSFGLPVALLLSFATFFYLQAKKMPKPSRLSTSTRPSTPSNAGPTATDSPPAESPPAPGSAAADVVRP